jgi:predicted MPP superfamily phosphohydrolase
MSKTVIIGDVHGRSLWKLITHQERDADRIIFIGDYFDSFDISGVEQLHNFKEIIEYKETSGKEVVLLIGNHDHHYFPEIGYTGTSGYQSRIAPSISQVIDENRHHLQMAYGFGEYLFTHAGVSPIFMDEVFGSNGWSKENVVADLNELFKHKPKAFDFNGFDPSGDNITQTPIWIRPRSLMASNNMSTNKKNPKLSSNNSLKKDYIQIVGHTQVVKLDLDGAMKAMGGRYYLIDCQGTTGEYLIIEDNQLRVGKTR